MLGRLSLVAAVGLLSVSAEPTGWQAIAYSPSTGQDGYAFNQAGQARAEADALEACQAEDCRLLDAAEACLTAVQDTSTTLAGSSDIRVLETPYGSRAANLAPDKTCEADEGCRVVRDICLEIARPAEPTT